MISSETIDKIHGTLPGMLVAEPWERDESKVALSINGKILATVLPSMAMDPTSLPWLEHVVPEESSNAIVYVSFDLVHNSLFVVYKGTDIYIYEYLDLEFTDFANLLFEDSLGSAVAALVKGKPYNRIATPTQLLTRLGTKLHAKV